ncbi:hypothetical protein JRQ81_005144 [Phrynocephalus forsythii]|uniref:SPRY-associated domain-containing protein n=1 Tax=Phrynocephalus forsythii TaxID=171643 RepID=A0A9Q0Y2J3_9SAUR|nr:hypothetical protein JRQ81_005144 [Phrynocephalus forsythii]
MEDKHQQPDLQFLQDTESTFDKCKVGVPQVPEGLPLKIKQQIQEFSDINQFLQGVMSRFKETLLDEHQLCKEVITLDPATAHPNLWLSKDQKSVRLQSAGQDLRTSWKDLTWALASWAPEASGWEGTGGRWRWRKEGSGPLGSPWPQLRHKRHA